MTLLASFGVLQPTSKSKANCCRRTVHLTRAFKNPDLSYDLKLFRRKRLSGGLFVECNRATAHAMWRTSASHACAEARLCGPVRTRLVWGFFCQAVVLGLLSVLCSEREGRSSFFNRAAGVKRVLSASGLRRIVVQYAGGTSLAKCCFFVRLRAVSSSRPVDRPAKRTL